MSPLAVRAERDATLTCGDCSVTMVLTMALDFTDFSLPEVQLYFFDHGIPPPSEW